MTTDLVLLLGSARDTNLLWARNQMALSLGWHIVLAAFGVAFPSLIFVAHTLGLRGNSDALELAKRWSKVAAVLFAAGAVSGTILSFELGLLWPGLLGTFGEVVGLAFALEGIAFFLEAIFLGIYLYGWNRLPGRLHSMMLLPVMFAGVAGTFFVVAVNSWMNSPTGFELVDGEVTSVDPVAAILNDAVAVQSAHMLVAAYMVTGFVVGAVYAAGRMKGRNDEHHRLGLAIALSFACLAALVQPMIGHLAGNRIADDQPIKLAAIEAVTSTDTSVDIELGGLYVDGELKYALRVPIPGLLSALAQNDLGFDAEVVGLESVPENDRPPVNIVRFSFQLMVGVGTLLALISLWTGVAWARSRAVPQHRWFLPSILVAGPASVIALEAGWVTTEVGRQPWVVHGVMRTTEAVTDAGWIWVSFLVLAVTYTAMTVGGYLVLRSLASRWRSGEHDVLAPYGPPEPLGGRNVQNGMS